MSRRARQVVALAAVLAGVALALQHDGYRRSWLAAPPSKPKPFVFDNGSANDAAAPAASRSDRVTTVTPPGALRKCVRGDQVTYTNLACPAGAVERQVSADRVTVLPSEGVQAAADGHPGAGGTQRSLHDALDLRRDEQLRQKLIDRAVAAEAR